MQNGGELTMNIKWIQSVRTQQTLMKQGAIPVAKRSVERKTEVSVDSILVSRYPKGLEKYRGVVEEQLRQVDQRVQEVKQQIKEGTYQVDSEAIVKALLGH